MKAIEKACKAAGGQSELAKALNISIPAVSKWIKQGFAPAGRALAIEVATKGEVSAVEILQEAGKK